MKVVTPIDLVHELDGVLADVDMTGEFDNVCRNTVNYVKEQLVVMQVATEEAEKVSTGSAITMPVSKEHAEAMLSVALAYLEQFKDKVE